MNWRITLSLIVILLTVSGCMERVDSGIQTYAPAAAVTWELVGTFGGEAQVSTQSDDPWEVRFAPGGFILIAGVSATNDEVWVCDEGISRLQVFDFEGNFVRSLGRGIPLADILPTDTELYHEDRDLGVKSPEHWEAKYGRTWLKQERDLFKAVDVAVVDDGYWIADWMRMGVKSRTMRTANVIFIPDEGELKRAYEAMMVWPVYLAIDPFEGHFAVSEPKGNMLNLFYPFGDKWPKKSLGNGRTQFKEIMEVHEKYGKSPHFQTVMNALTSPSTATGKYDRVGGMAFAFGKLVVCDSYNHRLQVYDTRREDISKWGTHILVVPPLDAKGHQRFDTPQDIDIDSEGRCYILDESELEVAVLSKNFTRLGSFARGDLIEPYALDLSDDGNHCFITDRRSNLVYHYAQTD